MQGYAGPLPMAGPRARLGPLKKRPKSVGSLAAARDGNALWVKRSASQSDNCGPTGVIMWTCVVTSGC